MKSNTSTISWAVVAMAACSLFSMIGTFRIDGIINHDLYQHGLQFSYAWAIPYWTTTAFVFAMGWLNLIIAAVIHVHTLALRRKAPKQAVGQAEKGTTKTETVEKPEEEKPKLIKGAQEQRERPPIEMQVRVPAHFVEISVKEGNEGTQTVTEEPMVQEQNQSRQSGQVEEQAVQEPESSEEIVPEQKESETETWETTAEKEQNSDEQTSEQAIGESEQSEETAEQRNEEKESPAESVTPQEGAEREQLRESEETPVL